MIESITLIFQNLTDLVNMMVVMCGVFSTYLATKEEDMDKKQTHLMWAMVCYLVVIAVSVA